MKMDMWGWGRFSILLQGDSAWRKGGKIQRCDSYRVCFLCFMHSKIVETPIYDEPFAMDEYQALMRTCCSGRWRMDKS